MRKSGNNSKWTDTKQLETVIEYLTGNDSAREIGDRLSLTEGTMRRWVRKWRHDAEQAIKNGATSAVAVEDFDASESDDEESPF